MAKPRIALMGFSLGGFSATELKRWLPNFRIRRARLLPSGDLVSQAKGEMKNVTTTAERNPMRRRMKELIVWTNKEDLSICIEQPADNPGNEDDSQVFLAPEQISTLIEWLQQAKAEFDSK